MTLHLRHACSAALLLALLGAGCGDDDSTPDDTTKQEADSGTTKQQADSGTPPSQTGSKLAQPGLPRPPKDGLPAELRPPR